jgi:hypothetical protein
MLGSEMAAEVLVFQIPLKKLFILDCT